MTLHDEFLNANAAFVADFKDGDKALPPARGGLVLACMDARLHPEKRLLGTKEVHIIHHTDCGMLTFTNEQIAAKIKADLGTDAAQGRDFLPFSDLERSVRDDAAAVRASPLVTPDTAVYGYVYDVKTGRLNEVAL